MNDGHREWGSTTQISPQLATVLSRDCLSYRNCLAGASSLPLRSAGFTVAVQRSSPSDVRNITAGPPQLMSFFKTDHVTAVL